MGETGMEESLAPITEAMEFGDVTAVYTVGRDGRLDSVDMVYSVTMDGASLGDPTASLTYAYNISMTINATGSGVRITFPDFSDFEEVTVPEIDTSEPTAEDFLQHCR